MRGFVAISTVLILGSVVVGIATTVSLLSIGEAQSGLALYKGEDSLNFVEGCAEDALLKSRSDANFPTPNPITFSRPEGTCNINVNKTATPWVMTVTNNDSAAMYRRTIEVRYTRNPTGITLTSWKEI